MHKITVHYVWHCKQENNISKEKKPLQIFGTAQALLANMAAMYAVYHGPAGLKAIANRIHLLAQKTAKELKELGIEQLNTYYFDTLKCKVADSKLLREVAETNGINFHYFSDGTIGIAIDETTLLEDVYRIKNVFTTAFMNQKATAVDQAHFSNQLPESLRRTTSYLTHPVFNTYHSESLMMRYLKSLENKDLSLNTSMISLGSCTMKLNAATELIP
jgi:glycine dehydrogenase